MSEHEPDPVPTPPTEEGAKRPNEETLRAIQQWVDAEQQKQAAEDQAEAEAKAILDSIERALPAVEQRIERLMYRYFL